MMFPPKKKLGGMIGAGKDSPGPPKYKANADEPEAAPKAMDHPPAPAPADPSPVDGDYGDRLTSDAIAPLVAIGLAEDEAKAVLAASFDAIAKCLRGEAEPEREASDLGEGDGGLAA